jgi:hypothetical protein
MEWLRANLWLNYIERGIGGSTGTPFRTIGEFTRYGGLNRTHHMRYLRRAYAHDGVINRMDYAVVQRAGDEVYDRPGAGVA